MRTLDFTETLAQKATLLNEDIVDDDYAALSMLAIACCSL